MLLKTNFLVYSTGVEYLLTAGHRLSRQDLKNAVRNTRALHQEFWVIKYYIEIIIYFKTPYYEWVVY